LLESDLFGINTNGYSHLHKSIFNKRQEEKLNIDKNLHSGHKILDGLDLLKLFRGMQVSKVPREMRAVVSGYFDISELEQKTIDTLIEYARVILHKQYDDEGVPFGFHNQIVCALFLCCIPSTRHEGVTKLGVKKLTDVYSAIREIDPPSKIFECISALGYDSLIVDTLIDIVKQDLALDIKLLLCLEITTMLGEKND